MGAMNEIKTSEHDVLGVLRPDTLWGALAYFVLFLLIASLLSRILRRTLHTSMVRRGHFEPTTLSFLQQLGTALIWVVMLILYAHLIPMLRSLGTALLTGASVASVVIGLAAQSTLGNLVAGISITLYKPFRLGDLLEVSAPTGAEIGTVEQISLGYTMLRAPAGHLIVLPNALVASSATLNLNRTFAAWPLTVTLRLARNVDVEAARQLALAAASEALKELASPRAASPNEPAGATPAGTAIASTPAAATGAPSCYLTKVEASAVTLELRLRAEDAAMRDTLRSMLLARLAERFAAAQLGAAGTDLPSFS